MFGVGLDPNDANRRTLNRAAFTSRADTDAFSIDSQAQVELTTGPLAHTLLFGVDYQHYDFDDTRGFGDAPSLDLYDPVYGAPVTKPPSFLDTDSAREQIGLYLQEQLKLYDRWVIALSGRQDFVSSDTKDRLAGTDSEQDDSEFSGRAGLVYLSDVGLTPYFSYSESFLPVLGTDAFGEAFKPETGRQYEVGLKYQPPGWNSLVTLAAFDILRQNVLSPDPFNQVQTDEIRSRGVELGGVASLDGGLDIIVAYTYQDVEVTESNTGDEGNRPVATPKHLASLWADYILQGGLLAGLGFGAGVRYQGSSFGDAANTLESDDFTLADAALHYEWHGVRFAVHAQNLFDNDHVAACFGSDCFYGVARTVIGSVRYRW